MSYVNVIKSRNYVSEKNSSLKCHQWQFMQIWLHLCVCIQFCLCF